MSRRPEAALRLDVLVQPRASRSEVVGMQAGAIKVRLTAPPVEGAANQALIELLAEELSVPRRHVSVVAGLSSRRKTVQVEQAPADWAARLGLPEPPPGY